MIKFKFLPVDLRCLLGSENQNHVCAVENIINQFGGLYDNARNLLFFVCERVLDLNNIGNLNVQSLKNLEPEERLKKYRMLTKCHATWH